jgi:lactate racemase
LVLTFNKTILHLERRFPPFPPAVGNELIGEDIFMSNKKPTSNRKSDLSRRQFIGLGAAGVATAAVGGMGRRAYAGTEADGRPYTMVRTAEHFGDEEIKLTFPAGWEVETSRMVGHDAPALTDDQIRAAIRNAIGTPRLADLADGKQRVAITFDDLTRPTPTGRIVPFVLEELHNAGIKKEQIIFQGSFGSHAAMFQQDMAAKIGADVVANYECWNHDCFHGFTDFGKTDGGLPVKLSSRFGEADLKICLSGIKKHGLAGFGGGAKAVIPGVAAFESITHLHNVLGREHPHGVAHVNSGVRLELEKAARLAGVDQSINIVMNGHRQVAGVHAGDIVEAHRSAVRAAFTAYQTELPKDNDVVVMNHYPQSVEAYFGFAPKAMKDGGTVVLIQDTPAGQRKIHYLGWSGNGGNRTRPEKGLPVGNAGQVIIFNRWPAMWDETKYSTDVHFASTWDHVETLIREFHGPTGKAVVFPTGPLSIDPDVTLRI